MLPSVSQLLVSLYAVFFAALSELCTRHYLTGTATYQSLHDAIDRTEKKRRLPAAHPQSAR